MDYWPYRREWRSDAGIRSAPLGPDRGSVKIIVWHRSLGGRDEDGSSSLAMPIPCSRRAHVAWYWLYSPIYMKCCKLLSDFCVATLWSASSAFCCNIL